MRSAAAARRSHAPAALGSHAIAALLGCAIAILPAIAARAETAIGVQDYLARLDASLTMLEGGSASVDAALAPLGLPVTVSMPGDTTVEVSREALIGTADTGGEVAERLRLAREAAQATAGAEPPDRSTIDAALAQAYEELAPAGDSLGARLLGYVGQTLGWVLDRTLGALGRSGLGAVVAFGILLALVLGALRVARRVRTETVADARWAGAGGGVAVDWRRVAERALGRGDLPEAVRALYHVLLGTLAARGVVHDAPSLTSGECRRAVRHNRPAIAPDVDRATTAFERVVYGNLPAREEDVEILREAERAVRRS